MSQNEKHICGSAYIHVAKKYRSSPITIPNMNVTGTFSDYLHNIRNIQGG